MSSRLRYSSRKIPYYITYGDDKSNEEYYKKEGEMTFCYMYNILEHTWNKIFVNKEDKDNEDENEIIE